MTTGHHRAPPRPLDTRTSVLGEPATGRGGTATRRYRCEAVAEGLVYGTYHLARCVLGRYETISPVLALRWLHRQAHHLADRLDPDPVLSRWARSAMLTTMLTTAPSVGCPDRLRQVVATREEQRAARAQLRAGIPVSLTVPDADCRYSLSIRPAPTGHGPRDSAGRRPSVGA